LLPFDISHAGITLPQEESHSANRNPKRAAWEHPPNLEASHIQITPDAAVSGAPSHIRGTLPRKEDLLAFVSAGFHDKDHPPEQGGTAGVCLTKQYWKGTSSGRGGTKVAESVTACPAGSPSHAGSVLCLLLRQSKLLGVTLPCREEPLTS